MEITWCVIITSQRRLSSLLLSSSDLGLVAWTRLDRLAEQRPGASTAAGSRCHLLTAALSTRLCTANREVSFNPTGRDGHYTHTLSPSVVFRSAVTHFQLLKAHNYHIDLFIASRPFDLVRNLHKKGQKILKCSEVCGFMGQFWPGYSDKNNNWR